MSTFTGLAVATVGGNFHYASTLINMFGVGGYVIQLELVGNYTQIIMRIPFPVEERLETFLAKFGGVELDTIKQFKAADEV